MTSTELKHRVKLQEWAARIQDGRSSGLSVRAHNLLCYFPCLCVLANIPVFLINTLL